MIFATRTGLVVELDHSNPLGALRDMLLQFDPQTPPADQQQAVEQAADNMNLMLKSVANAANQAALEAKAELRNAAEKNHDGVPADGVADGHDAEEPETAGAPKQDDGPRYVFKPVNDVLSDADASQLFWLSGLASRSAW